MKLSFEKFLKKLEKVKLEGQNSVTEYLKKSFFNDLNSEIDKIPKENIILKRQLAELYHNVYLIFEEKHRFRKQVLSSFYKWIEKKYGEEFFFLAWMTYIIELVSKRETNLIEKIKLALLEGHLVHLIKEKDSFIEAINIYDESEGLENYILNFCNTKISLYLKISGILDFILDSDRWKTFLNFLFKPGNIEFGNLEFAIAVVKFIEQGKNITEQDKTRTIKELIKYIKSSKLHKEERLNREISKSHNIAQYFTISEELDSEGCSKGKWSDEFKENIIRIMALASPSELVKLINSIKNIIITEKDMEKDKEISQIRKEKKGEIEELKNKLRLTINKLEELELERARDFWVDYKKRRLDETIKKAKEEVFYYVTQKMNKKIDLIIEKLWEIYQETKQLSWEFNKKDALERIKKNCKTIFNQYNVREFEEEGSEQLYDPSRHELIGESNKVKKVKIVRPSIVRDYINNNGRTVVIKKALVKKINKEQK